MNEDGEMVVRIVFLLLSSILFDICSIYGFKLSGIKLSFLKRSVTRTDFDGVPLSSFNHRYLPYEIYDRYKGQNVHANQVFKKVEVKVNNQQFFIIVLFLSIFFG